MSYQNLCNEEFLKEFDNLDEKRKIVFVTKDYDLKITDNMEREKKT